MTFKETQTQFQMVDVTLIDPDTASPRQNIDEAALKSLTNSIMKLGVIHPLVVQPANSAGRHTLIVGERRWRAAVMAGEKMVPALIRPCETAEVLDVQVAENMGLGVRSAWSREKWPTPFRPSLNASTTVKLRRNTLVELALG